MKNSQTPKYYMITNVGTLVASELVQRYPYHLVLAQLWAASPPYREACEKLKANGAQLILDNGAHEGIDIDTTSYMAITNAISPHIVVLPDLIGRPAQESRQRSIAFSSQLSHPPAAALADACNDYTFYGDRTPPRIRFMYAPQGISKDEIRQEFDWAQSNLDPTRFCIGIGQSYLTWEDDYVQEEDARFQMISEIMMLPNAARVPYHILGGRWSPKSLTWMTAHITVLGLDSIKPCHCALHDTDYPCRPRHPINRLSMNAASNSKLIEECLRFCRSYGLSFGGQPPDGWRYKYTT